VTYYVHRGFSIPIAVLFRMRFFLFFQVIFVLNQLFYYFSLIFSKIFSIRYNVAIFVSIFVYERYLCFLMLRKISSLEVVVCYLNQSRYIRGSLISALIPSGSGDPLFGANDFILLFQPTLRHSLLLKTIYRQQLSYYSLGISFLLFHPQFSIIIDSSTFL